MGCIALVRCVLVLRCSLAGGGVISGCRLQLYLFRYFMLKMFRMLIRHSSGACDLFVELFHGLYCSGTMRVGVTL
jgi:hypothetical protein